MLANSATSGFDSKSALVNTVDALNAEIVGKLMENGVVTSLKAVAQTCCFSHLSVLETLLQQGTRPRLLALEGTVTYGHADII